tara:strand:+ start:145 stop:471 length:327 start_codon:yes stop_codon:yes gene_type:complete
LLSIVASSDANRVSAAYVQGKHMEKLFVAMAENRESVDSDSDDIITAKELSDFLNKAVGNSRGRLVFAKSPDEPIFGLLGGFANSIPIINHEGPQFQNKRYIPLPQRR